MKIECRDKHKLKYLVVLTPWQRSMVHLCSLLGSAPSACQRHREDILKRAPYNSDPTLLPCNYMQLIYSLESLQRESGSGDHLPLWNFSSIGGTILRALLNSTFEGTEIWWTLSMAAEFLSIRLKCWKWKRLLCKDKTPRGWRWGMLIESWWASDVSARWGWCNQGSILDKVYSLPRKWELLDKKGELKC